MDNFTQTMAGTAVGLGSIALVGASMRMIPKDMMQMPKARPTRMKVLPRTNYQPRYVWHKPVGVTAIKRPIHNKMNMMGSGRYDYRKQNKQIVGGAMGLMVGIPLLGAAAGMVK